MTLVSLEYEKELSDELCGQNENWSYCLYQKEIEKEKKAYLAIERCKKEEFDRLVQRVVHQAARNGADLIYVLDVTGQMKEGSRYGYYPMESCSEEEENTVWKVLLKSSVGEQVKIWREQRLRWFWTKNTIPNEMGK